MRVYVPSYVNGYLPLAASEREHRRRRWRRLEHELARVVRYSACLTRSLRRS